MSITFDTVYVYPKKDKRECSICRANVTPKQVKRGEVVAHFTTNRRVKEAWEKLEYVHYLHRDCLNGTTSCPYLCAQHVEPTLYSRVANRLNFSAIRIGASTCFFIALGKNGPTAAFYSFLSLGIPSIYFPAKAIGYIVKSPRDRVTEIKEILTPLLYITDLMAAQAIFIGFHEDARRIDRWAPLITSAASGIFTSIDSVVESNHPSKNRAALITIIASIAAAFLAQGESLPMTGFGALAGAGGFLAYKKVVNLF